MDKFNPFRPTNNSTRYYHIGIRYARLKWSEFRRDGFKHLRDFAKGFGLVLESMREIGYMRRVAPHLIQPTRLYIPIYNQQPEPWWKLKPGILLLYNPFAILSHLPLASIYWRNQSLLEKIPDIETKNLHGGVAYSDSQAPFVERVVIENVQDAKQHGANFLNHVKVTKIIRENADRFACGTNR